MNRTLLLLVVTVLLPSLPSAAPIPAVHKQGSMHGFLLVKSAEGKVIGEGDLLQIADGDRVRSRLIFRFHDGSIDDESTVFTEQDFLRVVTDHHVQKGPFFPKPLDVTINLPASEVTWKETKDGKVEVNRKHMELPHDLANGILPLIIQNTSPDTAETQVSYLANDPKPRIVKLSLKPDGREKFTVDGIAYSAYRYVIHVELGGLVGWIAPFVDKQPPDTHAWVTESEVPAFAKIEAAFYPGGPLCTVELAAPVWPSASASK